MPPEVMRASRAALIAKAVLRRCSQGGSDPAGRALLCGHDAQGHLGRPAPPEAFGDIAKLLDCPNTTVYRYITEHMIEGSVRGGCKFCNGAARG